MSSYNCAFCRNPGATNQEKLKEDFIFVMCDGCIAQYKEHSQLGPKYAYCLCNPDKPREVEIGMVDSEVAARQQEPKMYMVGESGPETVTIDPKDVYVNKTYPSFDKDVKESKKRSSKKVSNL